MKKGRQDRIAETLTIWKHRWKAASSPCIALFISFCNERWRGNENVETTVLGHIIVYYYIAVDSIS